MSRELLIYIKFHPYFDAKINEIPPLPSQILQQKIGDILRLQFNHYLFACWVIFLAFVVCLLFSKLSFSKNSFSNTIRVSNGSDPDQDRHTVGPDLVQTVSKGYQQTTKVATSKERVKCMYNHDHCFII